MGFGPFGKFMFPLFALVFIYPFALVIKGYKNTDNKPQKRFILLLAVGIAVWILFGYAGAALFPVSSQPGEGSVFTVILPVEF